VIGVGESADLVSAIRRLQQDEAGRQEMGRASRRLLSERYSAERGVSNWIGLIGGFREPRS
jgi:glycosyltransferase involved in cell wall biosynthesis